MIVALVAAIVRALLLCLNNCSLLTGMESTTAASAASSSCNFCGQTQREKFELGSCKWEHHGSHAVEANKAGGSDTADDDDAVAGDNL